MNYNLSLLGYNKATIMLYLENIYFNSKGTFFKTMILESFPH